jgi:hypothetical protein
VGRRRSNRVEGTDRRAALAEASAIEDKTERLLEVAALIAEDLREIGRDPIVVGGLAVAYWAAGIETTDDIDVAMVDHPELAERLRALGLEQEGRVWVTPDRRVIWERPADTLDEGWDAVRATLRSGRAVRVISLEDAIIDRMSSLDATGDPDSFRRAVTLLGAQGIDRGRLERRAHEEALSPVLAKLDLALEKIAEGHTFESHEIHDLFPIFGGRP